MRKLIMLAGLVLVASLALVGAAVASASAAEIFLTNAAYPQEFKTEDNNVSKLNDGSFITIECANLLGDGILRSPTDALVLLLWHKCRDSTGRPCLSTGQPSGLILSLLLALPVWLNKALTLPGILFEKHQGNPDLAHFHCFDSILGTTLVLVRGSVLGHIPKPAPKVKSHTLELELKVVGGSQEFEKIEEGTEVFKLEASLNGGAFNSATEEVVKDVLEFTGAGVEAEFR